MMNQESLIRQIAQRVHDAGGRALLVGGCVRDGIVKRSCYDVDCEVHGITPDALLRLLEAFGEIDESGREYGIFTIRGANVDIALPRRERRTGPGHKDFCVTVDPWLEPAQAAARRDFTVNAIMRDALTGAYVDPFGGMKDLEDGVLRAVPGGQFEEDPLRVMRGAQFAARFGLRPDQETIQAMRRMKTEHLSGARVYGEMKKALLMAKRPGVFFDVLREADALDPWFSELSALVGAAQNPLYHPEGDAWTHTMLVLDEAAQVRDRASDPLSFMLAALTHDLGKAISTRRDENGNWHAQGHADTGVLPVERMLSRLGAPKAAIRYAQDMCRLHMRAHVCYYTKADEAQANLLLDESVCAEELCMLAVCDARGTGKPRKGADDEEAYFKARLAAYRAAARETPTAAQLMALGVRPGPGMKEALAFARKRVLEGAAMQRALEEAAEKYKAK